MLKLLPLVLAAAALTGCAVGPNYQAPRADAGASFQATDPTLFSSNAPEANWWANFGDPVLNRLIADALTRNHELRIARATLEEARALRQQALWAFAPSGAAGASFQRGRLSETESVTNASTVGEVWSAGFDAAWEIDVFGRARRAAEAAAAEVGQAGASLRDTHVALLAEVAANYFGLRDAEEAIVRVTAQVHALRESHALVQRRVQSGRGTGLDTARAEALWRETEALLPELTRSASGHRHRLAVLVGVRPGELTIPPPTTLPSPAFAPIRIGSPADLLRRRPDVQRAERALAAATAHIGVRTAALFPEVSVQGFLQFVGLSAGDLGERGTRSWTVAPTIRWRLFDYGRLRAQLQAAEARADGVLASYERTVLRALEDTENALARYRAAVTRAETIGLRHAAAERARTLANRQYEAGGADPLARFDAERTALAAERDVIAANTERNLALIAVYKALGGGWGLAPPTSPAIAWAAP